MKTLLITLMSILALICVLAYSIIGIRAYNERKQDKYLAKKAKQWQQK